MAGSPNFHMNDFENHEFEIQAATTVEEAKKLLAAGFDYVTEKDSIMLFKRPKRYNT